MNSDTRNRARRIAFMLSGGIDALLGAIMFILGAGTFAYNISRLEE